MKPVKLTLKTATELIRRVLPVPASSISGRTGNNGAVQFTAQVGSEGLKITCENDWFYQNGRIRVAVTDTSGTGCMGMFFDPKTLERDYEAEEEEEKRCQ